ncbi:hypothetical protein [Prosthecobacter sp.]|uniref:hypothetical protein n=1 Tax=Prosthecobacter sp. TaxID=1965333 RepID=UPI003783F455
MTVTKGIYQNGSVSLLTAVSWQNGTTVEVVVPESDEVSADGSPWPRTDQEREERASMLEETPAVFDSEEAAKEFEQEMAAVRREHLNKQAESTAREERIARSFD